MARVGVAGALGCAAAVLLVAPAAAVPIQGRVVHGVTGRAVPGLEVRVVGMEAGKPAVEVVTRTDPQGAFRARLEPERRTYVVQATYQGVDYTTGPHSASARAREVVLRVFDVTDHPPPLRLSRRALLLDHEPPWFVVREVAVVHNPAQRAYAAPKHEFGTWRLPLLRGAEGVHVVRGMAPAGVDPDGALVDTLPVLPGERAAVVVYRVRARGPSLLELRTGLPTSSVDLFVAEPLRVWSERLQPRETRRVEGRRVTWLQARDLSEDAVVTLAVEGVPAPPRTVPRLVGALLVLGCAVFVAWPWLRRSR